ncbi:MAG: response regulator [Maricaulaceae bacterium]|jgi:signal transduction histidine kinase/CheY-like chemotaxis protein
MALDLAHILDAVGDLVVQRDAAGRIVYVNAGFRRALGGRLEDWAGRWFMLAPTDQVDMPGGRARFDAMLDTVAGPTPYEWEATPLGDGGDVLVGRDVSTERAGAAAREGARAAAEARAEAKEVLFAAITHELRTPISGIVGFSQLLDRTSLSAEQRDYVGAIGDSGRHLLGLIEDMLDAAKLAAGEAALHADDVDPRALVDAVASLLTPRACEKGLEISVFIDPRAPARIAADAGRLRQVLVNLLANAVKFTETGGVAIRLIAEDVHARTARLRFEVSDSGPGVSEDDRQRIFEAFTQGDSSAARKAEGVGLGLSIARGILEAMGGEIGLADADPDRLDKDTPGATFFARAPFDVREPPQVELTGALDGVRVVVAAPEPLSRAAIAAQLAALGAETDEAADLDGLRCRLNRDPDRVAVVDDALAAVADADVAEVVAPARAALVLVAPSERAALADRLKSGFDGWLIKPCRVDSLIDRVARAARGERSSAAEIEQASVEPPRAAPPASAARVLLVEDNPVNRMLAMSLMKRMGVAAEAAESGEGALKALAERKFDLVLMDMRLPGLDGPETTRRLREQEGAGRRTPVIALTANSDPADRRRCLDAGMDEFLIKPIEEAQLAELIDRWTRAEAQSKLRA